MALRIGPGAMVAAAFIGPGTVTTASVAGASSGIALLWAVAFSVFATLTLQELSLRTALATQKDLANLVRDLGQGAWWGSLLVLLVILAIGGGNAAYQSGNLSGAGIGLSAVATGGAYCKPERSQSTFTYSLHRAVAGRLRKDAARRALQGVRWVR